MQKTSDLFVQNIKNLPIWVKQVIVKEVHDDLSNKLANFSQLTNSASLLQYYLPKISFKGKQELETKSSQLSDGFYAFMEDGIAGLNLFEITIKNNWTFSDTCKILIKLIESEFAEIPPNDENVNYAIAMFIAGKLKTGEFLKKIGKIDVLQLEQAIRYQKELQDSGRHIKMASILIKLGFISDKGLDSLLLLKEEARRHLNPEMGLSSIKYESKDEYDDYIKRAKREIARLEVENAIMKKRLKKILNIND